MLKIVDFRGNQYGCTLSESVMMNQGSSIAGKYTVESVLKQTKFADIYRGVKSHNQAPVLIKVLSQELTGSDEAVARFSHQYETLQALGGDHVVAPIDFGQLEESKRLFIVTEFLEGRTLREHLGDVGPLSVDAVVDYVAQACLGVQSAHLRKIVHRDLKPSNLFLTRTDGGDDYVKVIDFQFAKRDDQQLTLDGQAVGSPAYMAPEQMLSSRNVTPASDTWALGVVMYELATGKRPFEDAKLPVFAMAVLNDPHVPIEDYDPSLPAPFIAVVNQCLEKRPKKRFATAGQLRGALRPMLKTEVRRRPFLQIPPERGGVEPSRSPDVSESNSSAPVAFFTSPSPQFGSALVQPETPDSSTAARANATAEGNCTTRSPSPGFPGDASATLVVSDIVSAFGAGGTVRIPCADQPPAPTPMTNGSGERSASTNHKKPRESSVPSRRRSEPVRVVSDPSPRQDKDSVSPPDSPDSTLGTGKRRLLRRLLPLAVPAATIVVLLIVWMFLG